MFCVWCGSLSIIHQCSICCIFWLKLWVMSHWRCNFLSFSTARVLAQSHQNNPKYMHQFEIRQSKLIVMVRDNQFEDEWRISSFILFCCVNKGYVNNLFPGCILVFKKVLKIFLFNRRAEWGKSLRGFLFILFHHVMGNSFLLWSGQPFNSVPAGLHWGAAAGDWLQAVAQKNLAKKTTTGNEQRQLTLDKYRLGPW